MQSTKVRIDHTVIEKEFVDHLNIIENRRIIFSAPFGTGKSTFLKEFFSDNSQSYITLTLNPINYSVASNEDVFEWVKYDLLIELINNYANELDLRKEDFSTLFLSQVFILERTKSNSNLSSAASFLYPLIGISDKIGKPIVEVLKVISDTVKDFNQFKKEKEADEGEIINNYINSFQAAVGSPYEKDAISSLLNKLIHRLKAKRSIEAKKYESVLIIDDLDRLDPEHMFRLFNVFSAHYDLNDNNKFGFDKVVFVCDIENVRKVFHYRYGLDVDFSGYIDKFYSRTVYDFNNRRLIKDIIEAIFAKLPFNNKEYEKIYSLEKRSLFYKVFEWILHTLIDAKVLNLRMLMRLHEIRVPSYPFVVRDITDELTADSYPVLVLFELLKGFYSSYDVLELKLKKLSEGYNKEFIASLNYNSHDLAKVETAIASYCIPFFLDPKHAFDFHTISNMKDLNLTYSLNSDTILHYRYFMPSFRTFNYNLWVDKITREDSQQETPLNVFELLYTTFKSCREKGIF